MKRKVLLGCFGVYCAFMILLLFGRTRYEVTETYWDRMAMNVNLMPLRTIRRYLRLIGGGYSYRLRHHAAVNLLGNVVLFLPLGFFPPLLWPRFRPLWRCLLRCGGVMVCVELIQLLTLVGSCDVDDLLLNLLAISVGYGICRLLNPGQESTYFPFFRRKDRKNSS